MDVHLLVYDLSRGLARQFSPQLLGFPVDAVYHTSIKLNGREYVYDGAVVSITPGSSHLGRPEQEIYLGRTELPSDVVEAYLDSLREIYTVEKYNLWRHNCNNFSNDFATFLVGKGIPDHIINLPETVLNSPFGRMLMPMLDRQVDAHRTGGGILGIQQNTSSNTPGNTPSNPTEPPSRLHRQETHPHDSLNLPSFADGDAKPFVATRVPPLPKLLNKLGPDADKPSVSGLRRFIEARARDVLAPLPDVAGFASFVRESLARLPPETLFAVVDLLRCGLADPRFSGVLAKEQDHQTMTALVDHVDGLASRPYALRLVTLQAACNLFSSPLHADAVLADDGLRTSLVRLVASCFLDKSHEKLRVAAASLLYNMALANGTKRRNSRVDALPEADQVELAASALEAIAREHDSAEALEGMLRGLGWLVLGLPLDGELAQLLRTLDASETVLAKDERFPDVAVIREVGQVLLGKGLDTTRDA